MYNSLYHEDVFGDLLLRGRRRVEECRHDVEEAVDEKGGQAHKEQEVVQEGNRVAVNLKLS